MSLRANLATSYASQLYVAGVGMLMVPVYVRFMGAEAFGLVGFYAVLQAWFQVLDLGFTPTMVREAARCSGGAVGPNTLRRFLRILEGVFLGLAIVAVTGFVLGADQIAAGWLNVEHLDHEEVRQSIMIMAFVVALRWFGGLYRGILTGYERLVWLGGFNAIIGTVRFVLVVPFLAYVGSEPTDFFAYQMVVAVFELAILAWQTYRQVPRPVADRPAERRIELLRGAMKFSLSLAVTGSVWVVVTNSDKLLLSKLLSLREYAYFTVAVVLANAVVLMTAPVGTALVPRLTRLSSEGDRPALIRLYREATQLVSAIAIPVALVLALFADEVLWAWTGNAALVASAAPILTLYALGNGILAVSAFPYYIQVAAGDVRLHVIGTGLFVLLLVPAVIWSTQRYGAVGAGAAWLAVNAVYFLLWVPTVHRRAVPGLHWQWLLRDVGAIAVLALLAAGLLRMMLPWPQTRLSAVVSLAFLGVALIGAASLGSSRVREEARRRWRAGSAT